MSKSSTTTETLGADTSDWIQIPHAGEMLAMEFMEPLGLDSAALAMAIGFDAQRIEAVIDGAEKVSGELDLRLARYFRMSEGFFLRLESSAELRTAKRALEGEIERITPRAA